jgi:rRNA maturation endonuclease Nob1
MIKIVKIISVKEISKRTGDFPSLSLTDLKLLALTHDLHVEHYGKETVNYDVKNAIEMSSKAWEEDVDIQK